MKLEELQKIVEQRTKGEWSRSNDPHRDDMHYDLYTEFGGATLAEVLLHEDADLICALMNHIDEIMDVLRAAKTIDDNLYDWYMTGDKTSLMETMHAMHDALEKLEGK